jgi:hypothetical protein
MVVGLKKINRLKNVEIDYIINKLKLWLVKLYLEEIQMDL